MLEPQCGHTLTVPRGTMKELDKVFIVSIGSMGVGLWHTGDGYVQPHVTVVKLTFEN